MDVSSLMRQAARFNAQRTAIITEDRRLDFAEAWQRGVRMANGLRALGVRHGDRVAGLEDNTLGAADLWLGCALAGAVRVPLYPRNSRRAHAEMLDGTGVRVLVCGGAYAGDVAGLEDEVESLAHVLVRDEGYEGWLASQDDTDPQLELSPDDWYVIRHSAGTTGRPKGIGYTQHDWVVNCRNWVFPLERIHCGSVVGHAGPISHASGYLFLPAWLLGATNVLFGAFDTGKVISMMREHRVSHMFAVPTMLQALASHAEATAAPWPDLRSILIGGAPITDATAVHAHEVFGETLFQAYGQTEAVPLTMMSSQEWFGEVEGSTPLRAAGKVLPFARVEIRDEDGTALPVGEEGEVVAQVEGQMRGFWGDPELTKTRLIDGWVHTRDVGRLDANGYLYVLDRVDDMIVSGGFNIWPAELESAIADHPAVVEAAVFGIPDARWGETPMAVVVVGERGEVSEQEIIDCCAAQLGSYKKPSRVQITTDPLPKSVVGKLLRKQLREPYWAGQARRVGGA
jgi:acyl-CoA synthetase (AMP-forming)/AMP-acid ligase II